MDRARRLAVFLLLLNQGESFALPRHPASDVARRDARPFHAAGAAASLGALRGGSLRRAAPSASIEPQQPENQAATGGKPVVWPRGDALDKKIAALALPAVLNLLILPLVGIVDTMWVGRMREPLAIAGMQAANQVFSSSFWVISFLPTVVAPLIAKAAAAKDQQAMEDEVAQAVWLGLLVGTIGSLLLLLRPEQALSLVLAPGAPAMEYAQPYIVFRAISFVPALLSTIGFATYRGKLDPMTPLKITLFTQLLNVVLDPILIFKAGLGVAGASLATAAAEICAGAAYMGLLAKEGVLKLSKLMRPPSLTRMKPLLAGGAAVQLRALALNTAFLAVTRKTQMLDATGTLAAAHAITIQLWQLGGVFLFGVSGVAAVLVPAELGREGGGKEAARALSNRLLSWGLLLGVGLGLAQLASLPLLGTMTPLPEVQAAARSPSIIGAALQCINGLVFIGEGVMQGTGSFLFLALSNAIATVGMLGALHYLAAPVGAGGLGLNGVWLSFFVFNTIRLAAVALYYFRYGPLAVRNLNRGGGVGGGAGAEPAK